MGIIPEILRKTAPPHSPTMVRGAGRFLRSQRRAVRQYAYETIESAIAIIRNSSRILLTWDDDWDSWLLPNATIHEPDTAKTTTHDA